MKIFPDKSRFEELSLKSPRVPVYGEAGIEKLNPALLYLELFADRKDSFIFESGKGPFETARYSMMGASNGCKIRIENGKTIYTKNSRESTFDTPFEGLAQLNFNATIPQPDYLQHFWGGWVGYIGYEICEIFEVLPPRKKDASGVPDMVFIQVDSLIIYDHKTETLKYILSRKKEDRETDYERQIIEIEKGWEKIREAIGRIDDTGRYNFRKVFERKSNSPFVQNGIRSNLTREEYMDRVRGIKKYIEEGDIYQANLAQNFHTSFEGNSFDLYFRLRNVNPSPFSGFLHFQGLDIISSSPERLIKVENNVVETRPIAGTRPRGISVEEDRSLMRELFLSEKERAEHMMLVDLERNDLGRICTTGSVRVTELMFLEQYSHVNHIVSNIRGRLKPDTSVAEILKAVFPGGTITGCPKVRCMEIIHELEPSERGPYTGSFGYIGFSKLLDLNIIIRSIVVQNKRANFHVGAGIVADSTPDKEYQETLDKAAAMIEALSMNPGKN